MQTLQYLYMFIAGLLGMMLHISLKIAKFKRKYSAHPTGKIIGLFFNAEWPAMLTSLVFIFLLMLVASEFIAAPLEETSAVTGFKYKISNYIRTLFAFVGYSGSSLVYATFGKAEARLIKMAEDAGVQVDDKPLNPSDNATP